MARVYCNFSSVNKVVPNGEVLSHAIQWAKDLVQNSPDAVQSTKRAILLSLQHGNVEVATIANAWATESKRNYNSENIKVNHSIVESTFDFSDNR